jgi:hypothetical protein
MLLWKLKAPCASDAEVLEKLRYLFAEEIRLHGGMMGWPSILVAMATHFEKSVK